MSKEIEKPTLTQVELEKVAKASSPVVVKKLVEKFDGYKREAVTNKKAVKEAQKAVPVKSYGVVFLKPEGDNWLTSQMVKPSFEKEAILYLMVNDDKLNEGIRLIEKWNLSYEASIIYYDSKGDVGVYTKIQHQFVLIATKGNILGPKQGQETPSVNVLSGDRTMAVFKLMDRIHPNLSKLDMRKGVKPLAGWDSIK